jgi:thiamine biosynthesis lipoprotein
MAILKAVSTLLMMLFSCAALAKWHVQEAKAMGTLIRMEVWSDAEMRKVDSIFDQALAEIERLESMLSTYRDSSDISVVNQNAGLKAVKVNDEFHYLLERSIAFSDMSQGAFDITYASVGHQYSFRDGYKPSDTFISSHLSLVGYRLIKLKPTGGVYLPQKGMKIDLGGIAKGYAVDQVTKLWQARGVSHAAITAGGDTRFIGDKRGSLWNVGIRHPRNPNKTLMTLPVSDLAISTSGDYERFFDDDSGRVHHILQPSTGKPATGLSSVSIIAPESMTADALATSVFVLGTKQGLALINSLNDVSAIIVDHQQMIHLSKDLVELNQ